MSNPTSDEQSTAPQPPDEDKPLLEDLDADQDVKGGLRAGRFKPGRGTPLRP